MNLFDPDSFTAPGRTPKRPGAPTPPQPTPATIEVGVTDRWKYVHRSQPGVVHCGSHSDKRRAGGPIVTFCGLLGTPLTYRDGETVHGCQTCINRGAPTGQPLLEGTTA